MHRILDIKPEHESIIVDRVEAYVIKSLSQHFPHISSIPKAKPNQFAFSNEESTLITESSSYSEEVISSNPENRLDSASEANSETISEEETSSSSSKNSEAPQTDVKVLPLEKRKSTEESPIPSSPLNDETNKDGNERTSREKRISREKRQENQNTPILKTFLPRKFKGLHDQNLVTVILLCLVIIAVFILIYLLLA